MHPYFICVTRFTSGCHQPCGGGGAGQTGKKPGLSNVSSPPHTTTTTLLRQDLQHYCLTERPVPTTMHLSLLLDTTKSAVFLPPSTGTIRHQYVRWTPTTCHCAFVAFGHVCWTPLSPAPTESLKHLKLSKQLVFCLKVDNNATVP